MIGLKAMSIEVNKDITLSGALSPCDITDTWLKENYEAHTSAVSCFNEKVSDIHVFLIEHGMMRSAAIIDKLNSGGSPSESYGAVDLPFRTCFFEEIGTVLNIQDVGSGKALSIKSIFVHEANPREYTYLMLVDNSEEGSYVIGGTIRPADAMSYFTNSSRYSFEAIKVLRVFSFLVHASKLGKESHRPFIKIGTGKHKKTARPSMVIRVASKKDYEKSVPLGGTIDWQSRWEVRGHWREITGIGKNRDGEYCVQNWTWVIPHVRGPEDKIVVKKPRLITGLASERRGPEESTNGML